MTGTNKPHDEQSQQPPVTEPAAAGRRPQDILIVGGSLSGLFAAILLKRQGHNITVLEAAPSSAREGQAAGVGLAADVKRFFDQHDRLKHIPFGTAMTEVQILGPNLEPVHRIPAPFSQTTCDATYYRLRANFDGLVSGYCPEPPAREAGDGEPGFQTGARVLKVDSISGTMTVSATDAATSEQRTYEADIVIAADGASSIIRRQLYPGVHRSEPGFLIWRGIVPVTSLSASLLERVKDRTLLYPMRNSYLILYTIPGPNGSLKEADRAINFAWYDWPSATTTITGILTDTDGHTHRTTLPKGKMRAEIREAQLERAREMFHPELLELPLKLTEPFVSVISSVMAPKATAFDNRLFFIGDALVQLQPNSGQGTNHAAREAVSLAEVFAGSITAEEWEAKVLETARAERLTSQEFPKKWLYSASENGEVKA